MLTKTFFISLLATLVSANPAPQNTVDVGAISSAVAALPVASQEALLSSLSSYEASLAADPMYTSALGVIATAVPASDLAAAAADPSGYIQSALTATSTPDWYKNLPSSYQSYFQSIGSAQLSIVSAATATGAAKGSAATQSAGAKATTSMASATGSSSSSSSTGSSSSSSGKNAAGKLDSGITIIAAVFGGMVAALCVL